jgi:hypothetical protein
MTILGVTTPSAIPALILLELFVLNSLVGLVAGERYMRQGLVAAIGVHFWADIVWHVLWPLVANWTSMTNITYLVGFSPC